MLSALKDLSCPDERLLDLSLIDLLPAGPGALFQLRLQPLPELSGSGNPETATGGKRSQELRGTTVEAGQCISHRDGESNSFPSTVWCSSEKVGKCYVQDQSGKYTLRFTNSTGQEAGTPWPYGVAQAELQCPGLSLKGTQVHGQGCLGSQVRLVRGIKAY